MGTREQTPAPYLVYNKFGIILGHVEETHLIDGRKFLHAKHYSALGVEKRGISNLSLPPIWVWRSLVARLLREQKVGSSNLLTQTAVWSNLHFGLITEQDAAPPGGNTGMKSRHGL